MIALDTNVLIRFLVADNDGQTEAAIRLVMQNPICITLVVLVETVWVLESVYGYEKNDIINAIQQLLDSDNVMIENHGLALEALRLYSGFGADFSDWIIYACASNLRAAPVYTFDKKCLGTGLFVKPV